jgi:hypothetical protein
MSAVAELRNELLCAGYSPIPVIGKRPASNGWQEKLVTNADVFGASSGRPPNELR